MRIECYPRLINNGPWATVDRMPVKGMSVNVQKPAGPPFGDPKLAHQYWESWAGSRSDVLGGWPSVKPPVAYQVHENGIYEWNGAKLKLIFGSPSPV